MNAISNQKGAYQKYIRCHFSQDGQQKVTLKDVFIKKTENYILNLSNFHTNATLPLFMEDEEKESSLEINQKNVVGGPFPNEFHVNNRLSLYTKFNAGITTKDGSVASFIDRLRDFIDRFNYKLNIFGSVDLGQNQNVDAIDPGMDHQGLGLPPYAISPHDPITYVDMDDVVEYIRLGLTEDGRLVLKLNVLFLSNFYLSFGAKFRGYFGLPQYIWASTNAAGTAILTSVSPGVNATDIYVTTVAGDVFRHPANAFAGPAIRFTSIKSVFQADTRISIDIEASLPVYNSMTSEFSVEKQEHLLTRFPIPDYLDVQSSNQTSNNLVITGVDFQDGLSAVKDLVRDPHTHAIGMRSGFIQALNITLWIRYMMDGKIKKSFLTLDPNEWVDFTLVFTKKV